MATNDAYATSNLSEAAWWFFGTIVFLVAFLAATVIIQGSLTERNADGAREKTEQVQACTSLEDPIAALTCVQEIKE